MKIYPKLIVLIRHAESEGNILTLEERAKHPVGSCNYSITARGVEQAKQTGVYVRKRFGKFDAYYTSYFTRTLQTFSYIYPDVLPQVDPRLAEAQRGIFHSNTIAEIEKYYPGEIQRRNLEGRYHYRPPGGENWPDVEMRIRSFVETLCYENSGQKVLLLVHGHWMCLFQRLIQNISIEDAHYRYENIGPVENASVTIFKGIDEGGRSKLVLDEENIVPWVVN